MLVTSTRASSRNETRCLARRRSGQCVSFVPQHAYQNCSPPTDSYLPTNPNAIAISQVRVKCTLSNTACLLHGLCYTLISLINAQSILDSLHVQTDPIVPLEGRSRFARTEPSLAGAAAILMTTSLASLVGLCTIHSLIAMFATTCNISTTSWGATIALQLVSAPLTIRGKALDGIECSHRDYCEESNHSTC